MISLTFHGSVPLSVRLNVSFFPHSEAQLEEYKVLAGIVYPRIITLHSDSLGILNSDRTHVALVEEFSALY